VRLGVFQRLAHLAPGVLAIRRMPRPCRHGFLTPQSEYLLKPPVGTSGTISAASNMIRSAQYVGALTVYVNLEPMTPPNPYFKETVVGKAKMCCPRCSPREGDSKAVGKGYTWRIQADVVPYKP
jgi:hypothetical protein